MFTEHRRFVFAWIAGFVIVGLLAGNPGVVLGVQISTPETETGNSYRDPAGRFEIPIPTNWMIEEYDDYVSIVTDDEKIRISVVIVEETSASEAIQLAVSDVIGSTAEEISIEPMATPRSSGDEVALFTYDEGSESGNLLQAFGQRVGDFVFVLVLDGDYETIELRQIQVDKILTSVQVFPEALATPVVTG